jgi:Uma2 family endonuclease
MQNHGILRRNKGGFFMSGSHTKKEKSGRIKEQYETYDVPERYEIIDGIRYDLKPSPQLNHQMLSIRLAQAIDNTCHLNGIVITAPMDVHLDDENIVQPDIIYIAETNFHIVKGNQILGAPDLLVEILSPSSGTHDKIRKKALYEKFAVKEYWIADPILKTIDQFRLIDHKLQLTATYGEGDTLQSDVISCVQVDMEFVFSGLRRFEENQDA